MWYSDRLKTNKHTDDEPDFVRGYIICMRVHVVDILGDPIAEKPGFPFKCRCISTTQLAVTAPLLDHSDAGKEDDLIRAILKKREEKGADVDCIAVAMDNARKQYEKSIGEHEDDEVDDGLRIVDPAKKVKTYILQFPATIRLDSKVLLINDGKRDGNMQVEGLPVRPTINALKKDPPETITTFDGDEVELLPKDCEYRLLWRIADLSQRSMKAGASKKKSLRAATDAAQTMMEDCDISS